MKASKLEKTLCLLFGALILLAALSFLLPGRSYSPHEKRYLAEAPALSAQNVLSGRFADAFEEYLADHLPGRDALVGAVAYYDLVSGRQNTKEILLGRSGRLYERPVLWDAAAAEENIEALRAFAEKTGKKPTLMLIPSAGWLLREDLPGLREDYTDAEMIARCYALAGDELSCIDLAAVFRAAPSAEALYYATDHHWTSRGAHTAAEVYLSGLGRTLRPEEDYAVTRAAGFYGSTYARSALWLTAPEELELWDSGMPMRVTNTESEGEHAGLFYMENAAEDDKYTIFLGGNHALVRIENDDPAARGKLLVIRDSFSNCLGGFLAESYRTVVLVDLRYYRQSLSALCETEGFDDILVAYSIGNFLKESNLLWLE